MFRDILQTQDTLWRPHEEALRDGTLFVRLRGVAYHSALVVKTIESFLSEGSLHVWVELTDKFEDRWSREPEHFAGHLFDYEVEVPPEVTEIRFGKAGDVVWRRATAA